jgi:hypothetical protein
MQAFWDVVWSDTKALAAFVAPMLLFALPVSGVGALVGAVNFGLGSSRRLLRAVARGVMVGTLSSTLLSMAFEFSLRAEGLSNVRRALHDYVTIPLWIASVVVAFGVGFVAASRYAPVLLHSSPARRRYTLRQLFVAQLIVGLLLGWWVFTRRDEIHDRRAELNWLAHDRAAKGVFEPYGWNVQTWKGYDEIALSTFTRYQNQQPVRDETLALVAGHGSVAHLEISSDEVTDAGVAHLVAARDLRELWIASEQVTDEGVRELCKLPRLRYLGIRSSRLNGSSLERLAEVKSLRYVALSTTQITPQQQAAFRKARPGVELRLNREGR